MRINGLTHQGEKVIIKGRSTSNHIFIVKKTYLNLLNCDSYLLNDWPVHQLALVTLLTRHQLSSVKETPIANSLAAQSVVSLDVENNSFKSGP